MLEEDSIFVGVGTIVAVFTDLFPLFQIKALNLTVFRNKDEPRVVKVEGDCTSRTWRNLKDFDLF